MEGQYFLSERWGAALNLNFAKQSKTASGTFNIPGFGTIDSYGESNQFVYVAPTAVFRAENDKWGFYAGMGLGPIFYSTSSKSGSRELGTLNKTAFGSHLSVSGERRINNTLGAGIKLSMNSGKVKIAELGDTEQNVSNFTLTGFISFRTK